MGTVIKGTDEIPTKLNIVGVKYEDKFEKKIFSGREYSYYTEMNLEIGDIVEVPTRYGTAVAMVTRIDIPENEIENIKEYMKIIERKINKEEFLNGTSN